jgi:hypothetical protein
VLGGAHFWYFFHALGRLKYNDDDVSMWEKRAWRFIFDVGVDSNQLWE